MLRRRKSDITVSGIAVVACEVILEAVKSAEIGLVKLCPECLIETDSVVVTLINVLIIGVVTVVIELDGRN